MGAPHLRTLSGFVFVLVVVTIVLGCRQEVPPLFRRNQPPETTLTVIAEDSTLAFYRYHVRWRGEDPDGVVIRYLFAITDTLAEDEVDRWNPELAVDRERGVFTAKNDSVFVFNSSRGTQAFNIVAIDDFGEMDPSPARAFFRVIDNGLPRIDFVDVTPIPLRQGLIPCVAAESCTVSTFTDFKLRFRGSTNNGSIRGVTWQVGAGALWQPFFTTVDTFYVALRDTVAFDSQGDSLWAIDDETVSVFVRHRRDPMYPPAGNFKITAKVRDDAGLASLITPGTRNIQVNFDPETSIRLIPECDCPGRSSADCNNMVPMGWISGIGNVPDFPIDEWIPFCEGDTLPEFARTTLYASGADDPRDLPIDEGGSLAEVRYSFRALYGSVYRNMPFSPARPATDLPLPGGGTFRGAAWTWTTCGFVYDFQAGAVDEQNIIDSGTPAVARFIVSHNPTLDSLSVPPVIVFVPQCNSGVPGLCRDPASFTFGPDTMKVVGTVKANASTPFGIGSNVFVMPLKAWAHDDAQDRNPPGGPMYYDLTPPFDFPIGRIRAWLYKFNCLSGGELCQDVSLRGEGDWFEEVPLDEGEDVSAFDENLTVEIALDTLCTTNPCSAGNIHATLKNYSRFGRYEFTIQGRDKEPFGALCAQPSDFGPAARTFFFNMGPLGRLTQQLRTETVWVHVDAVRPPSKASLASSTAAFETRKRLMR